MLHDHITGTSCGSRPNFAKQYFVDKAIQVAEFILERIDKRWPAKPIGEGAQ